MSQAAHITHPARRKKTEVSNLRDFSLKPFQSLEKRQEKILRRRRSDRGAESEDGVDPRTLVN